LRWLLFSSLVALLMAAGPLSGGTSERQVTKLADGVYESGTRI